MSFNTSYVINHPENIIVGNTSHTVTQAGYHYFGSTGGRRNQKIADASKLKTINVEITVENASAGLMFLCFYSELGESLNSPYPSDVVEEDARVVRCIELTRSTQDVKEVFTYLSDDYPFLKNDAVGVSVYVSSPKIGSKISVKIWGGA